jgi:uncharacterized protein YecT (DUF1311 family)
MRLALSIAVLILILVPAQSKAADYELSHAQKLAQQIRDDCGDQWGVPGAIASCMLDKEKEYGLELEQVYKRLLKGEANIVAALRESQRSWLEYQKHNCKLEELGRRQGGPGLQIHLVSALFAGDDP